MKRKIVIGVICGAVLLTPIIDRINSQTLTFQTGTYQYNY